MYMYQLTARFDRFVYLFTVTHNQRHSVYILNHLERKVRTNSAESGNWRNASKVISAAVPMAADITEPW